MTSFRYPPPMFNQNFPRNNFNMDPVGIRHNMQPFQRPPNPTFGPCPPPERFMHGNFTNRPHFTNFPPPMCPPGFTRPPPPPPPAQAFPMNPVPNFIRPRNPFERPCRPWKQIPPSFRGPRPQLQNRPRAPVPSHPLKDSLQGNRRGNFKNRDFRKLKDDATVKPYSCDTCDKAFVSENDLKDHVSEHIRCNHENCMFEAHPKIVALHKKMQHDTGYADRINRLKDDAEILKWREERKKRFPTAENIQKRKAEQAEREARGEVLETKEFGKFKRRREDNGNNRNALNKDNRQRRGGRNFRKFGDRRRNFHPPTQPSVNVDSESDSDSDSHITLPRFLGMSSLANSAKEITDENGDVENTSGSHIDITPVSDQHNLPSQSLCEQNLPKSEFDNSISHPNVSFTDINSSNLDKDQTTVVLNDDKFNDTAPNSVNKVSLDDSTAPKEYGLKVEASFNESVCEIPTDEVSTEVIRIEDSDDEGPVAIPIEKSVENLQADGQGIQGMLTPSSDTVPKASNEANSENTRSRNHNRSGQHSRSRHNRDQPNGHDSVQVTRKSSLLEKLLADDIRHERNVVLQCIRHIVQNNFFGIEDKCLK